MANGHVGHKKLGKRRERSRSHMEGTGGEEKVRGFSGISSQGVLSPEGYRFGEKRSGPRAF